MATGAGALASAQAALNKANDFTKSAEGKNPSMFAPKTDHTTHPMKAHEFANAPYHMVHAPSASNAQEGKSLGEGLKANMDNEAAAKQ